MTSNAASTSDQQIKASRIISDTIIETLTDERGAHAETCVAGAARMAGTFLFRSFGLPTQNLDPGSPVFSELANQRGPVLVEVLKSGLIGLKVPVNESKVDDEPRTGHEPLIDLASTQRKLEKKLTVIATAHGLDNESAARACALATALLMHQTRSVLDPSISFGIAVYGFVQATKTVPQPIA